ncbi:MAG TPA: GAF domain-containing protein [Thermoanaerobaculia bacterium]|nr:GAF domain-containing protein [Thermoanaerobaculia bacterium]
MTIPATPFEQFAEAARVVSGELDLERVVQAVTDAATQMTGAQFGAFFYNVVSAAGESYMLYTISGVPREAFSRFPMPRNTAVFAPTFDGTATVRSDDIRKDPRYGHNEPYYGMPKGHLPVVSYLAVPVISRSGQVLGGLFFGHSEVGVFGETEERIVEAIAAQAAVAIDNARLYEALQRERARYKTLVFAAPTKQALWLAHPNGEVLDDLQGWREITGQSQEEVRHGGWANAIHPDDRKPTLRAWAEATASRKPFMREYRLRMADGSYRWFAATGVPVLDERGEPLEWVGTSIDVHDRKTSEDKLHFLARASDLLASSLDYETTLTTVAQLAVPDFADWCAIDIVDETGVTRRLAVAHIDPAKIELAQEFHRRYPPHPETDTVARVIRTGRTDWMAEIPVELLDRAARDEEHRDIMRRLGLHAYVVAPLRASQGHILGAITFVRSDSRFFEPDISFADELARRAGVAIENARLYGEARAANRAKDDFLATLSHELRTPMTAVLGWARMLQLGMSPRESVEAVNAIEKSATVQMQLIEDILDMSRIMAGKMRIEHTPVDLREVTEAALATVRPTAAAKAIEIFTSYPPSVPPISGDSGRLQQIIWNLLTNAIKFTDRGGTVFVRVSCTQESVSVAVKDSGIGIDRDFLPHVFERFRQQDSSTTRAHGGIGLGLTIVRHLVDLHRGRITAHSEGRGHGAMFVVDFPALPARIEERPAETRTLEELPSLAGMTVLVVDDESMTLDVLTAILRRSGAAVLTAGSAAEARERLREQLPNAIVCDIAMPGEDGYMFVKELRSRHPDLPIVALTAFGRPEDRERALNSGFDAYLKKPVDPATLAATLREIV